MRKGTGWYEIDLRYRRNSISESPALCIRDRRACAGSATRPISSVSRAHHRVSRENFSAEVSDKGMFDFKDDEIRPGT